MRGLRQESLAVSGMKIQKILRRAFRETRNVIPAHASTPISSERYAGKNRRDSITATGSFGSSPRAAGDDANISAITGRHHQNLRDIRVCRRAACMALFPGDTRRQRLYVGGRVSLSADAPVAARDLFN